MLHLAARRALHLRYGLAECMACGHETQVWLSFRACQGMSTTQDEVLQSERGTLMKSVTDPPCCSKTRIKRDACFAYCKVLFSGNLMGNIFATLSRL